MNQNLGINLRWQVFFWLCAFLAFLLFVWMFSAILLPFIAGMALAYMLDPVADWFEKHGIARLGATIIILTVFVLLFFVFLILLVPILANQVGAFLERLPDLVTRLQALVASSEATWLRNLLGVDGSSIKEHVNTLMSSGAGWIATVIEQLWASGKSIVNVLSLMVVTPIVAFYLLYDWDHIVERIDQWLPRDHRDTIHTLAGEIDGAVAGFVRGQGTVCLVLGVFYAVCLTVIGVNFGLLIGLFAGLISFIPFVGSIVGFLLSLGVALVQFWPEYIPVVLAGVTFMVGQFIEGNFLQPQLVGREVGLHPVWLMFALFAFGSMFGFTGMLIAVPTAAAIGVIARFCLQKYLESDMYLGTAAATKSTDQAAKSRQPTRKK